MKPFHARTVILRSTVAILICLSVGALALIQLQRQFSGVNGIGGPFTLVDQHGKTVTEKAFLGKPMLVFFGYTFCPDVCPTTLFELTSQLKELGGDANRLNVLFITVDPERDTPDKLALYLSSFDPHITGLSGSEQNIKAAMSAYRAVAIKVPAADGGYTMDHTAIVYMMNSMGQFVGSLNYEEPETAVRAKIKRLIAKPAT